MFYPVTFVTGREIDQDPILFPRNSTDTPINAKHGEVHPCVFQQFFRPCDFYSDSQNNSTFGSVPAAADCLLRKEFKNPVRATEKSLPLPMV